MVLQVVKRVAAEMILVMKQLISFSMLQVIIQYNQLYSLYLKMKDFAIDPLLEKFSSGLDPIVFEPSFMEKQQIIKKARSTFNQDLEHPHFQKPERPTTSTDASANKYIDFYDQLPVPTAYRNNEQKRKLSFNQNFPQSSSKSIHGLDIYCRNPSNFSSKQVESLDFSTVFQEKQDLHEVKSKLNEVIKLIDKKIRMKENKTIKTSNIYQELYFDEKKTIELKKQYSDQIDNNKNCNRGLNKMTFDNLRQTVSRENIHINQPLDIKSSVLINHKQLSHIQESNEETSRENQATNRRHYINKNKPNCTIQQTDKNAQRFYSAPKPTNVHISYKSVNPLKHQNQTVRFASTENAKAHPDPKNLNSHFDQYKISPLSTKPTSPNKIVNSKYQSSINNSKIQKHQQNKGSAEEIKMAHKKHYSQPSHVAPNYNQDQSYCWTSKERFSFQRHFIKNPEQAKSKTIKLDYPQPFQQNTSNILNPFKQIKQTNKLRQQTQQSIVTTNFHPVILSAVNQILEQMPVNSIIDQMIHFEAEGSQFKGCSLNQQSLKSNHKLKKKGIQVSQYKKGFQSHFVR